MKSYKLHKYAMFSSIQGEGHNSGKTFIFLRFNGCNLTCSYCDTVNDAPGIEMTAREIGQKVLDMWPEGPSSPHLIITGGEPLMPGAYDKALHEHLASLGILLHLETSGSMPIRGMDFNYVTISPKCGNGIIKKNFPDGCDEWRYPYRAGCEPIEPPFDVHFQYVSPIMGEEYSIHSIMSAVRFVKDNPGWMLSVQTHKLIGIE